MLIKRRGVIEATPHRVLAVLAGHGNEIRGKNGKWH